MKIVLTAVVALALTGCATKPEKIAAQYVSPTQYKNFDCDQIGLERAAMERRTNELFDSLKKEARGDAWQMGIGLAVFWPALLFLEGGDGAEASEYARLKGEYEALRVNSVQRKCDLGFSDDLKDVVKQPAEI